jgi:hypothetical protein
MSSGKLEGLGAGRVDPMFARVVKFTFCIFGLTDEGFQVANAGIAELTPDTVIHL